MKYETIEIEYIEKGSIALLQLNRPEVLNTLNFKLASDFVSAIEKIEKNKDIRAVIITGKGKGFSAGGDLTEFKSAMEPGQFLYDLADEFHKGILAIRRMNTPFIAAINGPCFGVGLSLAACCDIRIASTKAKFCFAFTGVGISADSSLPYFLPKIVGLAKATEMAMFNSVLKAQEALDVQLVNKVVEADSLLDEAKTMAVKLSKMPTITLGKIKSLYNHCYSDTLEEHLDKELQYLKETADTEDFKEGCSAFFERRAPIFKGK